MTESGPGTQPADQPLAASSGTASQSLVPQNAVVAAGVALVTLFVVVDGVRHPGSVDSPDNVPLTCGVAVIAALAQAVWITLDCRRRGAEVGFWRFAVLCIGPLAVWAYLVSAYRARALLWIPVSGAVYAAAFGTPVIVLAALGALR